MPKSKNSEIETLIQRATLEVERHGISPGEEKYLRLERIGGKRGRISPTWRQGELLEYIRRRGAIPFAETLAMDWRFLGGLFNRGKVAWVRGTLVALDKGLS
jgi:hypothetical protein